MRLNNVKVRLRPIVSKVNLPTVLKTAIFPGDSAESLIIATQVGEMFYIRNGAIGTFLDIRSRVLKLGASSGGYDERGLLGLAFHPGFHQNGLFYVHYSAAGSQGPGALDGFFQPNPCDPGTRNMRWSDRQTRYDHIDTIEEWMLPSNGPPRKRRTLLNLRRPFFNHNGVNSLNFSPETGRLVVTTGDGGSGYDPFQLSQDDMEIAGKIFEVDVASYPFIENPPAVTRFDELPASIRRTLAVIAKGVRNIPGIAYQRYRNQYIKYAGNVGQDLVESIYAFVHYRPLPVEQLVQAYSANAAPDQEGVVNFGWRGWEGAFPTSLKRRCSAQTATDEKIAVYYDEAIETAVKRTPPLTCYYHQDPRPGKFSGTALTGVQPYMGHAIPGLAGRVVFTDFARQGVGPPVRGVLAYTWLSADCKLSDYRVIDVDHDFGAQSAYYVSLGTNRDQTRLYLGVYGSMKVTDLHQGTVFEMVS